MDANNNLQFTPQQWPIVGAWLEGSQAINEVGTALALAQAEMTNPVADQDNPFFKSKYADLAGVLEACKGPLNKHGIAIFQGVVSAGSIPGVRTLLIHKSGQWLGTTCFCDPKDKGPQAMGSVITYLRRYSLAAAAGIAQEDDDAEAAQPRAKPKATARELLKATEPAKVAATAEAKNKIEMERLDLLNRARSIIGTDLRWDLKTASDWLQGHTGKPKLASLTAAELSAVVALLTLYGDEKYHEALDSYAKQGLLTHPPGAAA